MNAKKFEKPVSMEIPKGFAGIEAIKSTHKAQALKSLFEQYKKGAFGVKNSTREKAFSEATKIKNAASRLYSFFVALCRQGYVGTLCPLDCLSDALKNATGGLGEARTLRRAINELAAVGVITKTRIKTGSVISTPKGDLSLCVLRINFCPTMWDIIGNVATVSYNVTYRPKRPLIPKIKAKPRGSNNRPPLALALTNCHNSQGVKLGSSEPQTTVEQERGNKLGSSEPQTTNKEQLGSCEPYTSDRVEPIATTEKATAKNEPMPKKEILATYQDFLNAFWGTVQNYLFSVNHPNAEQLVLATQNHLSKKWPEKAFGLRIDLIEWAQNDWLNRRKIAIDFSKKLESMIFSDYSPFDGFVVPQVFKIDASILRLCFAGKMKIEHVPGHNLANWTKIFNYGEIPKN